MTTEMILGLDECYSPDDDEWYGHANLIPRIDGELDFKNAKKIDGCDESFDTQAKLHDRLIQRSKEAGWKWDRVVVVSS